MSEKFARVMALLRKILDDYELRAIYLLMRVGLHASVETDI